MATEPRNTVAKLLKENIESFATQYERQLALNETVISNIEGDDPHLGIYLVTNAALLLIAKLFDSGKISWAQACENQNEIMFDLTKMLYNKSGPPMSEGSPYTH